MFWDCMHRSKYTERNTQESIQSIYFPSHSTESLSLTEMKQDVYFLCSLCSGKPTFCSPRSSKAPSKRKVLRGGHISQRPLARDSILRPVAGCGLAQAPADPVPAASLQRTRPCESGFEGEVNSFFSTAICLAGHAGRILVLLSLLLLP